MEQGGNTLEQAKKVADGIKGDFESLEETAKGLLDENPVLDRAIKEYGGLRGMLNEGFQFNAFGSGAVNAQERIMAYEDFRLANYLEANEGKINLANLQQLQSAFKERKEKILELLKTPVAEEDAKKVVESLHEDLILKTLESDPIFG